MSAWDTVKSLIRTVAPTVGTALGGPLAGTAVRALSEKFLGKPDGTQEELASALASASPADLAKLKELEQSFALEMRKLDVDVFKAEVEDTKNARELAKMDIRPHLALTGVFVTGYFAVLFYILDPKNFEAVTGAAGDGEWLKGVATTIIGVLTAAIPQILGFWFGSSLGSKQAGHTIEQIAKS